MSKKPRKKTTPSQAQPRSVVAPPPASESMPPPEHPAEEQHTVVPRRHTGAGVRVDTVTSHSGNVTALLECNVGLAEGLAMMGQAMLGLTRESMQSAARTGLALIDSRSLPGAWALGLELARDQVDRLLRGSAELTEIGWRTATATCEPFLSLTWAGLDRPAEETAEHRQ
jgi:hypothetical protein